MAENKQAVFIDWEQIQWEYENSKVSFRALGKKWNVSYMTISRRAKAEDWVKYSSKSNKQIESVDTKGILGKVAVRKILEIKEELGNEYSVVDEPLLMAYGELYERYLKLVAIVNFEGETVESPKTGATYLNPNFTALQSVRSEMAKLGDKLGLSIASRKRLKLKVGKQEETKKGLFSPSKFTIEDDVDV